MNKTENEAKIKELAQAHEAARGERRKLERELADIDTEIKAAVARGDAPRLSELGRRKRELPFLIGEAGALENAGSNKEWAARLALPVSQIPAAEEAIIDAERAIVKRRAEHEQEIAALESEVVKARQAFNYLSGVCSGLSDTFGKSNARFKEELTRLNS
jgi:predicted  nucleic acid-binding Zn-ribbon protein